MPVGNPTFILGLFLPRDEKKGRRERENASNNGSEAFTKGLSRQEE